MNIQVAVVDGDAQWRSFVREMCRRAPGVSLAGEYATGEEAVKQAPREKPHVVLLDTVLAGMNGIQCTRRLKQALPKVRIVIVAELVQEDVLVEALRSGADGYLLKTQTEDTLLAAVREAASGGVPLAPEARKALIHWLRAAGTCACVRVRLSAREAEVLELRAAGLLNKEVADRMQVKPCTVNTLLERVRVKLDVRSSTAAVAQLYGNGHGEAHAVVEHSASPRR
ncbi:MAG: response regulator transcription factor [Verrucomicrobia bacterium]|nr:response regulator transcription factor [Verrucomicrobiota bacterium]